MQFGQVSAILFNSSSPGDSGWTKSPGSLCRLEAPPRGPAGRRPRERPEPSQNKAPRLGAPPTAPGAARTRGRLPRALRRYGAEHHAPCRRRLGCLGGDCAGCSSPRPGHSRRGAGWPSGCGWRRGVLGPIRRAEASGGGRRLFPRPPRGSTAHQLSRGRIGPESSCAAEGVRELELGTGPSRTPMSRQQHWARGKKGGVTSGPGGHRSPVLPL